MSIELSTMWPRPRTLIHPGEVRSARMQSCVAPTGRHFVVRLKPGTSLYAGLVEPLEALGVTSASTTILGGAFSELQYCTAPPDPSKQALIAYGPPVRVIDAWMVFGNATLAKGLDGSPLVHCHAAIQALGDVARGGHIVPQHSIVGRTPISVLVTALDGFSLQVAFDGETNIPLIQPVDEVSNGNA
ncbi:MAG: DUF296 domain-containing protein [Variovorax paradoxus]|uniref:DUF296 domain-containing protein n=1 Tax=Variovorax paradoxus TaxID=34073 RepID=A0A2W5QK46_VARPD|nr:MAG: DUF296 domain-containing protein [Variovorax paradoxus]